MRLKRILMIGALAGLAVSQAFAQAIKGQLWTGDFGVTETVEQLMAREAIFGHTYTPDQDPDLGSEYNELHHGPKANIKGYEGATYPPGNNATRHGSGPYFGTVGITWGGGTLGEAGVTPPDTQGDVSPTQIIQFNNGRIKLFDKAGTLGALNVSDATFFNSVRGGAGLSDPRVVWDPISQRWFICEITTTTPNRVVIAVSNSAVVTNTSSFTFYFFQQNLVAPAGDSTALLDYPSMGVDALSLTIGGNMFAPGFTGCSLWVVNKASVMSGGPIVASAFRSVTTSSGTGMYAPRGVINDDPAATESWFIGVDNAAFSKLDMRKVTYPGGVPTLGANIPIAVNTTVFPQTVLAQGSTSPLDALDDRLFDARMKLDPISGQRTVWTAHNIEVTNIGGASTTGNRDAVRWYQIWNLSTTPAPRQTGTIFDPSGTNIRNYWIGSITPNGQGHALSGFSAAGAALFPSVGFAGRLATDPLGQTDPAALAFTSTTSFTIQSGTQRWGDYSETTVDPADNMTFWTFQEYCNATDSYAARIVKILAPPPATVSTVTPSTLNQGDTNVNVALVGSVVGGSGWYEPGATFPNHIAASVSGSGVTVNTVTYTDPTHITLNITVAGGAAVGARTITVTNPDGQSLAGGTLTISSTNNPIPTITSISPATKLVGDATFTLTVNGTNFIAASTVRVNGSNRTTTFVNATQLTASIPASDLLAAGTLGITVFNPAPGGGTSNVANLAVNNPVPTITSINPASRVTHTGAFTLTVNGTGFINGSTVRWGGIGKTTTFVSSTQLTAQILASDILTSGVVSISVVTAGPGGGTSNSLNFTKVSTTLNGTVVLGDYVPSPSGRTATVSLYQGTTLVSTQNVVLNGSGGYSFTNDIDPGTYDVYVRVAPHWLQRKVAGVVIGSTGTASLGVASLINGDIDGDGEIGPGDFGAMSSSYGAAVGDGNYNPDADLDGDGEVGPSDFGVLSTNYGLTDETP